MKILFKHVAVDGTGGYARLKAMGRALVNAGHDVYWLAPGMTEQPAGFRLLSYDPARSGSLVAAIDAGLSDAGRFDLWVCIRELDALTLLRSARLRDTARLFFQRMDTVEQFQFHSRHSLKLRDRLVFAAKARVFTHVARYVASRVDTLAFQAPFLRDTYLARCGSVRPAADVLPNQCALHWTGRPAASPALPWSADGPPVIAVMSNMWYRSKGIDTVLTAFDIASTMTPLRLALLGPEVPGENQQLITRRIAASPFRQHILQLGFRPQARDMLRHAAAFVAPAPLDYCPNSVLEAMSLGIPIAASAIPAHRFLLEHDPLLFETGNAEHLAARIRDLVTNGSRQLNQALVRQRAAVFSFDWEAAFVEMCGRVVERARHRNGDLRRVAAAARGRLQD